MVVTPLVVVLWNTEQAAMGAATRASAVVRRRWRRFMANTPGWDERSGGRRRHDSTLNGATQRHGIAERLCRRGAVHQVARQRGCVGFHDGMIVNAEMHQHVGEDGCRRVECVIPGANLCQRGAETSGDDADCVDGRRLTNPAVEVHGMLLTD